MEQTDSAVDRKFQSDNFYDQTPHFKRVHIYGGDIIAQKKTAGERVSPEDFKSFDSLHYAGYGSFLPWFESLEVKPKRVLDLGAGNGSSSRLLAHKYGCEVVAVEYLPYNCRVMAKLNEGCEEELTSNGGSVEIHEGDFLAYEPVDGRKFDLVIAFQVIYHFEKDLREKVYSKISSLLNEDGHVYIEDFCADEPLNEQNLTWSREIIKAANAGHLETKPQYEELLAEHNMFASQTKSLTKNYSAYVFERLQKWYDDKERCLRLLSENEFKRGAAILASTLHMFHDLDKDTLDLYPDVVENYDLSLLDTEQQLGGYQLVAVKRS
eukprot:CAMPEP_0115008690 /NCGR_PEP_ID=MMETSP0216-20121206/22096_1 /TAXON_ID=223996 /ORGANISM="Protocruzia adherens, Strain Boccale" /LENGTH=322 /DNA_ID=CAMNT_0002376213 /DNA_START=38 /DNA_END=1006 /DNA_ORIENTATION=-